MKRNEKMGFVVGGIVYAALIAFLGWQLGGRYFGYELLWGFYWAGGASVLIATVYFLKNGLSGLWGCVVEGEDNASGAFAVLGIVGVAFIAVGFNDTKTYVSVLAIEWLSIIIAWIIWMPPAKVEEVAPHAVEPPKPPDEDPIAKAMKVFKEEKSPPKGA